ncbi:hypothetical protein OROMI_022567 [Orobanche minor]
MNLFRSRDKMKKKYFQTNGGLILEKQLKYNKSGQTAGNASTLTIFSSNELDTATDNFNSNRILGGGVNGTVFRGTLVDERKVAVKKSNTIETGQNQGFINEIVTLSQIDHRNIVKLLGCCLETEVPHLVYEFVPKGDLAQHLRREPNLDHEGEHFSLSWDARLRIAIEVSEALVFMHSSNFYHRDVKSANILLDQRYKAKLADFGISRSVGANHTHLTTASVGTDGYVDPEFSNTGKYTEKSDVYSFGVVMVELLTGRIATDLIHLDSGAARRLGTHFLKSMESGSKWMGALIDARMNLKWGDEAIDRAANLAKRCLNESGRQRPTMEEVRLELEKIRADQTVVAVPKN